MGVHTILDHGHDWSTRLQERGDVTVEIRECLDQQCDAKEWHRVEKQTSLTDW